MLKWWKELQILSCFASDVPSVLVSTVSYESAFSLAGLILDEQWLSLISYMVEILALEKDWGLADHRAQEMVRNYDEIVYYFKNLYMDGAPQSSHT